jgi:predicted dehydrogenase
MTQRTTRRDFLKTSTALGAGYWVGGRTESVYSASPNEKLNIAIIGPGGKGASNLAGVAGENIVAFAEVDDVRGGPSMAKFPMAKRYKDFRKLLDKEEKNIDAVVVSTPDHIHVPAAVRAMRMGKHCYCEKPLSHSVSEARLAAETAKKYKVATQMGTQIHAGNNYRRVVEIVQSGLLGDVTEVHVWSGAGWGGVERSKETPAVPKTLDWDLWMGPAPTRPYHSDYVPFFWRRWWDFGSGTLGDMGCHYMDLPFWALGLRHPQTISAKGPKRHPESCPLGVTVDYQFGSRDKQPPVHLKWYDNVACPKELYGYKLPGSGVLFKGSKGMMLSTYSNYKLFPEKQFAGVELPPQTIPNSIGHHAEWLRGCKTGEPTTCNFDYSGALTESVLLGTVAYRVGKTLEWDPKTLKATNCPEADQFLRLPYRKGWELS